ncbi:tetraacyldisaccharide 4'-kinase [bacterium]|nr:tetraacyldisaccharide 4'-kinase [bacterium]
MRPEERIDRASYLSLIRGESRGLLPALARGGLRAASWGFRAGVLVRSELYGSGLLATSRATLPVISIGNLTTGGTGKTPLALALAERLASREEKVAVIARGYGAERPGELNDELRLVRSRLPDVRVYAGGDRVAQAERAAREGATVALLDDGFQHRRLARDVDILVVDASDPFGTGPEASPDAAFLLPRGLLREPLSAARRATAIVLSRADQAGPARVEALRAVLRENGVTAPVALMQLEALTLRTVSGDERLAPTNLRAKKVVLLSGIGNPDAFAATARSLGAVVARTISLPDHHAFVAEDLAHAARVADEILADMILVTEKDAVKIAELGASPPGRPLYVLSVDARLLEAEPLLAQVDAVVKARHVSSHQDSPAAQCSQVSLASREVARPRASREALSPGGAT